jgi:4-amino-4-deoxy-L-arabinose transferase-like glycosyltransferase
MQRSIYFTLLVLLLFLKVGLVFWGIQSLGIGLGPDEAQYWTWSKDLDIGYYSKPPGIAWQIWAGTKLFGDTELGIRFPSIILSFITALSTFYLALFSKLRPSTAFWAGAVMALSPLGMLSSFLAITDIGMVLFWTLACCIVVIGLANHKTPNYYILGFCILCGALFKWPIYLFWLLLILAIPFFPSLRNKTLFFGIAISLLGLLPSVFWNSQHQWVTFRHVLATINGEQAKEIGTTPLPQGNFWDFIGAQASLLSPIFFILLLIAFWHLHRKRNEVSSAIRFCGFASGTLLLGFAVISMFQKMQGNWCDFIYPPAIVLLTWVACEVLNRGKLYLILGFILAFALLGAVISLPYVQSKNLYPNYAIPAKISPFRHNVGWNHLEEVLEESGYNPAKTFLFADKYQTSSILSFYGPNQKRAYFFNLQGTRKNQFSFWPGMVNQQKGKNGFFVVIGNAPHLETDLFSKKGFYQHLLEPYFKEVHFIGIKSLFYSYGVMTKGAMIFECIDYNGETPKETERY